MKARYRRTFAGFLWVVLSPILTLLTQALVFGYFLNIRVENYGLFLVSGLMPWLFVSQTVDMSTPVFVNHGSLIKSLPATPLIYLSAQWFDNLTNFISSYTLVLTPFVIVHGGLHFRWVLLPLPIAFLAVGVYGLALLLATANVFFNDTRFVVSFAMQIGFFLTPIFYPTSFIPAPLRWITTVNPIYYLIRPFQLLLSDGALAEFESALGLSAIVSALLFFIGFRLWQNRKAAVYFYV